MLHADNYEEGDDILHILKTKTGVSFISMEWLMFVHCVSQKVFWTISKRGFELKTWGCKQNISLSSS